MNILKKLKSANAKTDSILISIDSIQKMRWPVPFRCKSNRMFPHSIRIPKLPVPKQIKIFCGTVLSVSPVTVWTTATNAIHRKKKASGTHPQNDFNFVISARSCFYCTTNPRFHNFKVIFGETITANNTICQMWKNNNEKMLCQNGFSDISIRKPCDGFISSPDFQAIFIKDSCSGTFISRQTILIIT